MNRSLEMSRPSDVPGFVDRVVRPLTHLLNPLILRIAGGWFPLFCGGYFWLGLAFGENSGWARNVLAAGDAELRYRGTDYHLVEATVVNVADVESKLVPPMVRLGSAVAGVHKVLRMRNISSPREEG